MVAGSGQVGEEACLVEVFVALLRVRVKNAAIRLVYAQMGGVASNRHSGIGQNPGKVSA